MNQLLVESAEQAAEFDRLLAIYGELAFPYFWGESPQRFAQHFSSLRRRFILSVVEGRVTNDFFISQPYFHLGSSADQKIILAGRDLFDRQPSVFYGLGWHQVGPGSSLDQGRDRVMSQLGFPLGANDWQAMLIQRNNLWQAWRQAQPNVQIALLGDLTYGDVPIIRLSDTYHSQVWQRSEIGLTETTFIPYCRGMVN